MGFDSSPLTNSGSSSLLTGFGSPTLMGFDISSPLIGSGSPFALMVDSYSVTTRPSADRRVVPYVA